MILTGPLCSHFPYHCPQPVQLLAWPFRWQRPADRHGGHLVRTTLLLPWHLSQDIWTFRHISSIFTCFTFLAVHQFMSFLQARVPKVAALSVVWIANGEIWWTSSLAACCGILQQPISLVFPGHEQTAAWHRTVRCTSAAVAAAWAGHKNALQSYKWVSRSPSQMFAGRTFKSRLPWSK